MSIKKLHEEIENFAELMDKDNANFERPEDKVSVNDVVYGAAVEDNDKAKKHLDKVFKEMGKKSKGVTPENPDTGKVLQKSIYTERVSLDENLFESFEEIEDDDDEEEEIEEAKKPSQTGKYVVKHDNGRYVSPEFTVGAFSKAARFETEKEAEDFISDYGKDTKWKDHYEVVDTSKNEALEDEDIADFVEEAFWDIVDEGDTPSKDEVVERVTDITLETPQDIRRVADSIWDRLSKERIGRKNESFEEDEEEIECEWCGEKFPREELLKEKDLGYICHQCKDGIRSRGEIVTLEEGYELLSGTEVEMYSDLKRAQKRANELGLKEAEYGDAYGVSYCYFNKSGDRDDDEEVIAYYAFENGKPRELTDSEARRIERQVESSFDDREDNYYDESLKEAKNKVEELPDDVYTLVYDRLFPGNKNYRPLIATDIDRVYDVSEFQMGDGDYDIGVAVKEIADAELAQKVAEFLGLPFELRSSNNLEDDYKFIAFIKIPDDIGAKSAEKYLKDHGKNIDDIRIKNPTQRKKSKDDEEGEEVKIEVKDEEEVKEESLNEEAKIYIDIGDFHPWSGAEKYFDWICINDRLSDFEDIIEEVYPDGISETQLNDILRFEPEWVFDMLGVNYNPNTDEIDGEDEEELDDEFEEEEGVEVVESLDETKAKSNGDMVKAYNKALKIAKDIEAKVVYGYTTKRNPGKFFEIKPIKYDGDDNKFRKQYGANVIYVAYPDKGFVEEEVEEGILSTAVGAAIGGLAGNAIKNAVSNEKLGEGKRTKDDPWGLLSK